jgi:stearoyl-CoA desaturase (Delta-9 desaturase)
LTEAVSNGNGARPLAVYAVAAVMLLFHVGALSAIFVGTSTPALIVAVLMYLIRGFGVTAGFHRLLAHRSFQTSRPVQFLLALAGSLAMQGGPLWWVAHHRAHHRETDTFEDIHSPTTHGFWQSHMGWMMTAEAFQEKGANSRDLHKFPEIKFLQRHYVLLVLVQALALFGLGAGLNALYPDLGTSGLQMLVWGLFVSIVALWHATFMVNSVCHIWGGRPNKTGDDSTNNPVVALFALGEGWHNNHHAFPFSARHGLRWWQFDLTWMLLKTLEKLGLVSNLKVPKANAAPAPG